MENRDVLTMSESMDEISEIFKSLGHSDRLKIIIGLVKNECNVGQIQKKLCLPQSTISQHLRILRNKKIIKEKKKGNQRCYRVIDKRVVKILKILE